MPVSRRTAEGLSSDVAAIYGRAEVRLLQQLARHLEADADAPDWLEKKLAELQLFRKRADKIVTAATAEAIDATTGATQSAYLRGAAAGQGDVDRAGITRDTPPRQAEYATEALARAQAGTLEDIGPRIVRSTEDAYRDAVNRAAGGTLTGATTRVQDAQAALDELARKGITGFIDSKGRKWGLEGYVDMATRTVTAQAAVAGHLDRLQDAGIDLVVVSTSSRECEVCRPWEGKVLSQGPLDVQQTNVVTGETETIRVDGTVREATSAGLFHPNCTHNLSGYIHGATKVGEATSNPDGYEAQQRQRAMERKVREWKRREAAAMTPEARSKARGKVREWQGELRTHTAVHDLPRKPRRESFDVNPPKVTAPTDLPVGQLETQLLEQQMADLMADGDYGERFEAIGAEMDARDQAAAPAALPPVHTTDVDTPAPATLGAQASEDQLAEWEAENEALHTMLFGAGWREKATEGVGPRGGRRDPEKELRDDYDTWVHRQWLKAEDETRGHMLSVKGQRAVDEGRMTTRDLFDRRITNFSELASEELQRWFAEPGNTPMSFPEFRSGIRDDKAAREAGSRLRNRGWSSEFG